MTDAADAAGGKTRAIILIPGMDRDMRDVRRDILAENLIAVVQTRHLQAVETDPIPGETPVTLTVTQPRGTEEEGDDVPDRIDLFEAHWADMLHDVSATSPWGRLWSGFELLLYWLVSASSLKAATMKVSLIGGALMLIAWYMTIAMNVAGTIDQAGATGTAVDPGNVTEFGFAWLIEKFTDLMSLIGSMPLWGVFLFVIGFLKVEKIAQTAQTTKNYLLNKVSASTIDPRQVGLRDRLRERIVGTLNNVLGEPDYSDVIVVAHSFGAVLAVDALSEWPHDEDFPRIKLVTMGSPIELLEPRSTVLKRDKMRLLDEGRLRWWSDYHSPTDRFGAKVPDHDAAFAKQSRELTFDSWWWTRIVGGTHYNYYQDETVLTELATSPCGPVKAT